jgi:hypothetical protein
MFVGETDDDDGEPTRSERVADSLLRDRGLASRSWEVTQVNEMLTLMERHPFPFACTTNLAEALDPATARRFLFKIRFLAMSEDLAREAFRRTFGAEPPAALAMSEPSGAQGRWSGR